MFKIGGCEGAWRLVVPLYVRGADSKKIGTYALLDGGSTRHVISTALAKRMGIEGEKAMMSVTTLDHVLESEREVANVEVESLDGFPMQLEKAIFGRIVASEGDVPPKDSDVEGIDYLSDVSFRDFTEEEEVDRSIGVIIGAELAWDWETGERRAGERDTVIALKTSFGWGLIGPKARGSRTAFPCHFMSFQVPEQEINENLDKLFARDFEKVDEGAVGMSVEDKYAIKQLEDSIRWDPEVVHYRVAIPWKYGREETARRINALDSDGLAIDRLRRGARKMRRDPERMAITFAQMRKFEEDGQARDVDPAEHAACPAWNPKWSIPVHVADKPGKPGQVRVCHDCKAPVEGKCLNDFILDGPPLACDLVGVIMRFRDGGEVAIGADIAAFFHHVYTDERDSAAYRYWWYENEEMTRFILKEFYGHVFGSKSSSCVATFTLRHHVEKNAARYGPEVVETVKKDFYVDDWCKSVDDVETARRLREKVTEALKEGGFSLCKFKSTHRGVLEETDVFQLPDNTEDFLTSPTDSAEKILGMRYDFASDVFFFQPKSEKVEKSVKTKREMLKVVASLYDPMGFICPFVIKGRMQFQRAVKAVKGWNDKDLLPERLISEFQEWQKRMPDLSCLRIPRWTASVATRGGEEELHVFSDASLEAYGVVAYRRTKRDGGQIHVAIVFAKAHVVPLKVAEAAHHESVPRLELQAARLATEVKTAVERETRKYGKVTMWTDSQCVLKQLRDETTRFKMYFANRISSIHAATKVGDWRYVPSADNPADDVSRGLDPAEENWRRFHHGPSFLWEQETEWPAEAAERLPESVFALTTQVEVPKKKAWVLRVAASTSSWQKKLLRVAGMKRCLLEWVRRRKGGSAKGQSEEKVKISVVERKDAERLIIKAVQQEAFSSGSSHPDRRVLGGRELAALCPFLDDWGVMRCGGRLARASGLEYDAKFPVILPYNHEVVRDLLMYLHCTFLHAGADQLLGETRRRFWVTKGRRAVRHAVASCVKCQRAFKAPMQQRMAPLPAGRLEAGVPFRHTGVDACGPFRVKIAGRAFHKVWVCLYTCLAVRAVHLEVLRDMSASSFINSFMRFRARRPGVRQVYSDNGSNFSAAEKEIRAEVKKWNEKAAEELRLHGVEWTFTPPTSAHRGGIYERLVRSLKKHLTFVVQQDDLHIETLATVIAQAEFVINSRPLTHVGADPRDERVLSPMDFLCPGVFARAGDDILPPSPPGAAVLRYTWQQSRALVDSFWKRWSRDYVSALQARPKWRKVEDNLKVGDVVLMVEEQLRRGDWRMAKVIGTDGQEEVRTVTVRTAAGKEFLRDRTKVVRLELDPARIQGASGQEEGD